MLVKMGRLMLWIDIKLLYLNTVMSPLISERLLIGEFVNLIEFQQEKLF